MLLILFMMLLAAPLLHAQPCPVAWGPTLQVSNVPFPAFSPKLAVVGDTVHVTYSAGDIYYRRSPDGGETWEPQVVIVPADSVNPGAIPPSAFGHNVYAVWGNRNVSGAITSIKIRRSTDAGTTWLEPQVLIHNVNTFERLEAPKGAVYDSSVYVIAYRPIDTQQWFLTRSTDSGVSWDSVRQITFSPYGTGFGAAGDIRATTSAMHFTFERSIPPSGREIVYTRSTDNGSTWSSLEILSTIDDYQAWEPNVAADDAGNVYVSWQDAKYGSIGGFAGTVLLRRSTDNGQTWLPEVQVSSLPSARGSSLSVDGGSVHAVWDDERNGFQDGTIQYRGSTDQGATWCSEMILGGPLRRALNASIASASDHVYAVWSSDRSVPGDTAQVFVRRGDITTNVRQTLGAVQQSFIVAPPYPNPFNPITTLEYSIPSDGPVIISIFDNLGRTITIPFEGSQAAGRYRITLDGSEWASGVYHVVVRHHNAQIIREVVLIR